jgi:hypothetical protein
MQNFGHTLLALVAGPWVNWPAMSYQRVGYRLRLAAVQEHFATCLDVAESGAVRVVSLCAGDGRDVMGVLAKHARCEDVEAWLLELDRESVASGIDQREEAGLEDRVTFIHGDATDCATYRNIVPCDIVLVCGVLGHVRPDERPALVQSLRGFCKPGGKVIWTRGVKRGMARFTEFQKLFEDSAFELVRETFTPDGKWGICTCQYLGPPRELPMSGRIFNFDRKAGR